MSSDAEFDRAVGLRDEGRYPEACEILESIEHDSKEFAAFWTVLADTYWELERIADAIETFRRAISLAPYSELASVGLFHCLFEDDQTDAAFDEMRRFLSISDSEEYTRLLNDLKKEDLDTRE